MFGQGWGQNTQQNPQQNQAAGAFGQPAQPSGFGTTGKNAQPLRSCGVFQLGTVLAGFGQPSAFGATQPQQSAFGATQNTTTPGFGESTLG